MNVVAVDSRNIRAPETHRRGRLVLAAAVVVLAFVGIWSWVGHRDAPVRDVSRAVDTQPNFDGRARINEQWHLGYWLPEPDVDIDRVSANVTANSAAAAIGVTVCRDAKSPVFGAARGDLRASCGSLGEPRNIHLGPNDYVVVTVVPLKPGIVDVRGIGVDLRSGSHHWHEDTGMFAHLRVH